MKRLTRWVILGAALLAGVASAAPAPQNSPVGPVVLKFEPSPSGLAVRLTIGGTERRMLLATESPTSYLRKAPDGPVPVEAGGASLGKVRFGEPGDDQATGVDGAIGMDLLQGMSIGFDEFRRSFVLWPHGVSATEADAWVAGLPAWGAAPKARRIKLGSFPTAAPAIEIDGVKGPTPALLNLGSLRSRIGPSVVKSDVVLANGGALFSRLTMEGLVLPWLVAGPYEPSPELHAVIVVTDLGSRREIIDIKGRVLYIEDVPEEARISKFLEPYSRISIDLRGDDLRVQLPPGSDPAIETATASLQGMPLLQIADVPAKEWIGALRGKGDAGSKTLAALLEKLFGVYTIKVQTPTGAQSFNVPAG